MFFELGGLLLHSLHVVICLAIPLTAGARKGHVVLGIILGSISAVLAFFTCFGGLPCAFILATIINFIPQANRPLLSQVEIEKEMARVRGY